MRKAKRMAFFAMIRIPLFLTVIGTILNLAVHHFLTHSCFLNGCSLSTFGIAGFLSLFAYTIIGGYR